MHSYHSIALATSTLSSLSRVPSTGQHQIFIASLFFYILSICLLAIPPSFSIQVISISKLKGPFRDLLLWWLLMYVPSSIILLLFRMTLSSPTSFVNSVCSLHPFCHSLCRFLIHFMPSSQSLLHHRFACWSTLWRMEVEAALGESGRRGVGVSEVEVGAISWLSLQQW